MDGVPEVELEKQNWNLVGELRNFRSSSPIYQHQLRLQNNYLLHKNCPYINYYLIGFYLITLNTLRRIIHKLTLISTKIFSSTLQLSSHKKYVPLPFTSGIFQNFGLY